MQLKCSWRIWWYRSDTAMKECPQPAKRPELFGTKSIQNVMKNNYDQTKPSDHLCRQKHQTSQNNHRHTDHPDDQQNRYVIIDVEKQAKPRASAKTTTVPFLACPERQTETLQSRREKQKPERRNV